MDLNFFVCPQAGEMIDTTIHINQNAKPALVGNVIDIDAKPIKDAFLIVYEVEKSSHKPITITSSSYTDEWGNFALAPLETGKLYNVKVYANNQNKRTLETNIE